MGSAVPFVYKVASIFMALKRTVVQVAILPSLSLFLLRRWRLRGPQLPARPPTVHFLDMVMLNQALVLLYHSGWNRITVFKKVFRNEGVSATNTGVAFTSAIGALIMFL